MTSNKEGVINYDSRARQLMLFQGMTRHRKITPTDIDGLIDYNGEAFLILEGKVKGTPLQYGQQKAIENLSKAITLGGKECIAILFEHQTEASRDVLVKDCTVSKLYVDGTWKNANTKVSVLETINLLEQSFKQKGINI